MDLEDLPNGFTIPTRAEIRDKFQRDYKLRQPGSPTGPGSQPYIDGSVIADALTPLYADAASIGRGANLEDMTREQLKAECRAMGIPEELPASSGSGFVIIAASAGGVYLDTGRQWLDESRNLTFRVLTADTYYNGKAVPLIGVDTGPNTNIPANTKLKCNNPPPGLANVATVQADADGNGFTGGRDAESDDDIRNRITTTRGEQPVGGNVAQVRTLVKEAGARLGIAIEEVFVYPAILGSGHYCFVFTLRPGSPGDTRIPTATDIAAVRAYVVGALPEDDGIFAGEIIAQEVSAKLGVTWSKQPGVGWVDAQPWPNYADAFYVETVTSATAFRVTSDASSPTAPTVGKTIAFYDSTNRVFIRKRILSATISMSSWDLVIDGTNNASDVNYTPSVDEEFCPYSPSLPLLIKPFLGETDQLGPGEQVEEFFDEGYRQKRMPENPLEWPSDLRHNTLDQVDDLAQIHDVDWLYPEMPFAPDVGVPATSSNLITIASLLAFPL